MGTAIGTVTDILYSSLVYINSTITGTPTVNFFDTNLSETTDDHYNGNIIVFTSGVLIGQASIIVDYNGTTKEITVDPAFTEAPSSSDSFTIITIPIGKLRTGSKGLEQIYDKVDDILEPVRVGDTITADGSEQTLFIMDSPSKEFKPDVVLLDVTNMQAGDTTVLRVYYRIISGGSYILKDEETYTDDEAIDLKEIKLRSNVYGIKVTLEQTGGTNRDYDYEIWSEE